MPSSRGAGQGFGQQPRAGRRWWPAVAQGLLGLALVGVLAGCPSKAPGHLRVEIRATIPDRCDDGVKVELDFDKAGLTQGPPAGLPENDVVYGGGSDWIWVKPGKKAWLGWVDDPYDRVLPGGPITITAWCMRTGGQAPGKSVRSFRLEDYVWSSTHVLVATFVVRDMSFDPDTASYPGYAEVTTPAPSIFDWEEWCDLGVPGDCTDVE